MRFVHEIHRLKHRIMILEDAATDVSTMMDKILTSGGAWMTGEKAMYTMLEEVDAVINKDIHGMSMSVAGYEYRRDFGTS